MTIDDRAKEFLKVLEDNGYTLINNFEWLDLLATHVEKLLIKAETKGKLNGLRFGQGVYMNSIARRNFLKIINKAISNCETELQKE